MNSNPNTQRGWLGTAPKLASTSTPVSSATVSAARPDSALVFKSVVRLIETATMIRPVRAAAAPASATKKLDQASGLKAALMRR